MLDYARAGDTVVVTAIDRLGRSVAEVTRTITDLVDRRIALRALREGIDTATPTGRAVAAIMATLGRARGRQSSRPGSHRRVLGCRIWDTTTNAVVGMAIAKDLISR